MSDLRPRLSDISYSQDFLGGFQADSLSDVEFRALYRLVYYYAATLVWTYSEPHNRGLPDDDKALARLCHLRVGAWRKIRPAVQPYFDVRDGGWHLNRQWVRVTMLGVERPAIPASLRSAIVQRDGFRCMYCGTERGPFDIDHIVPLTAGGAPLDPENLITACPSCNRSKGASSVEDWISGRRESLQ